MKGGGNVISDNRISCVTQSRIGGKNNKTRKNTNKTIHFKDHPDFTPNLTPSQIFRLGSFGGTYWRPIYSKTSCYGHFGRSPNQDGSFSWEKLDLAEKLLSELS